MHLIEILLPLRDANGEPFPAAYYDELADRLTNAFGGVTSFLRAPAEGRWHGGGATQTEDIAVMEVMARSFDREWWMALKDELKAKFRQDELIVRCQMVELL
ncbi:MAG: hypothetical protein K8F92_12495 [Hyphomicrobium sp.]|uniref:hypothetical protein n=1 Tax=Hyphomicrobium sp. TaxID=82 RepID=UPI0013212B4A|nr:hypothetical protein [Hyphomicrobium sp.]KAB2940167.1 MAG: hypothetical protein F9K20_14035 [Hyphomicrobium sp.]MBZ0210457.1 hypothetical protein [Hyphomicrobium sp.]MCZ7595299.1 hypothetical protein [Hyphomicrobium sp.]